MDWHEVVVNKVGDTVTWSADGTLIATVPIAGAVFGGTNIFFGMFDINDGSSSDPNDFLNTAVFDNVRVEAIPEPSSAALLGIACFASLARRSRRR
jgi:hypothetical protein